MADHRNSWWFRLLSFLFGRPWKPFLLGMVLIVAARFVHVDLAPYGATILTAETKEVVRDLGIAFFVGAIISIGIESIAWRERNEEVGRQIAAINRNVLQAVLQRDFPDEYFKFILDTAEENTFYRIEPRVDVFLKRPETELIDSAGEAMLIYEVEYSYQMRNVSPDRQVFTPRVFIEKPWDPPRDPSLVALRHWRIGETELDQAGIAAADCLKADAHDHKNFVFPVGVPLDRGQQVYVETRIATVKYERDSTTWCSIYPSSRLRLIIHHPSDFEVYAHAKHPGRGSSVPVGGRGDQTRVVIDKPLFPFTTVEIYWRPKPKAAKNKETAVPPDPPDLTVLQARGYYPRSMTARTGSRGAEE